MAIDDIKKYAKEIQIPYLVHFTRAANLQSVMRHGLYPISRIGEIGAIPEINDAFRFDGHKDGICLSIGFPNYRMFYSLRQDNPDVEWVVLVIAPAVLWVKDCAFCRHNAADRRISSQPLRQLKTHEAFVGMFEEIDGLASRKEQWLKPFDPTDGQAEVLVFNVIEPKLIGGVAFQSAATRDAHQSCVGDQQTLIHQEGCGMFASRPYKRLYRS
jgi:hypothetical protein